MDDITQVLQLGPSIVEAARLTVQGIDSKVQTAKANSDKEKTITNLESIINELLDNQNSLIRNQQVLENKLDSQVISDEDLNFISTTLIPLAKDVLFSEKDLTNDQEEKINEQIKMLESLVSTKLLKVLQLIGFNIKDAVGTPSTNLVRTLIEKTVDNPEKAIDYNTLLVQREMKMIELSQDLEATIAI